MKERLTGAIVLVALMVLLVPELLTGPAPSVPASETFAAPAAASATGSGVRSYTLPLSTAEHAGRSAAARSAPKAAPRAARAAASRAAASPAIASPPTVAARPVPRPERARAPATRPERRVAAATHRVRDPARGSRWALQLGVFALRADALRLQRRVRAWSIPTRMGRIRLRGRALWRVTAGPLRSRGAARALARRLRARGLASEMIHY